MSNEDAQARRGAPSTMEELMIFALEMERESVARYNEFADKLATHNNRDVAEVFRKLAGHEAKHAAEVVAQMGWTATTVLPRLKFDWPGFEAPETAPIDEVDYRMQPYHALQLALAAEERAERLFTELASRATSESVRQAALEMKVEEAEHAAIVKEWMAKVPSPDGSDGNWVSDPDRPSNPD